MNEVGPAGRAGGRRLLPWLVGYGPAALCLAGLTLWKGPSLGWLPALAVGLPFGLGVLGLSALVLAWAPWLLERLGRRDLAARLRRRWDDDAR